MYISKGKGNNKMIMITKLTKMPYANARVIKYDDGTTILQSYKTQVAEIDKDGWLQVFGLYSATTRRHISAFMREYTNFDYYMAKDIYISSEKLNLATGEIVSV